MLYLPLDIPHAVYSIQTGGNALSNAEFHDTPCYSSKIKREIGIAKIIMVLATVRNGSSIEISEQ